MHERGGEVEAALHASRVRADAPAQRVTDVDEGGQVADAPVDLLAGEAVQTTLEAQELDAGLERIEGCFLQCGADVETHLPRLVYDVVAGHDGPTAGRRQQRAEHVDGGGLPGPVGTEKAVDLAGTDVEVDVVDCDRVGELPHQPVGGDGISGGGHARERTQGSDSKLGGSDGIGDAPSSSRGTYDRASNGHERIRQRRRG